MMSVEGICACFTNNLLLRLTSGGGGTHYRMAVGKTERGKARERERANNAHLFPLWCFVMFEEHTAPATLFRRALDGMAGRKPQEMLKSTQVQTSRHIEHSRAYTMLFFCFGLFVFYMYTHMSEILFPFPKPHHESFQPNGGLETLCAGVLTL